MVSNPEFYLDNFKDCNLHNFTFHYEACPNPIELIQKAKKIYPNVGLSIRPKTQHDVLSDELLQALDLVLIMSVEPGFGGQKFIPNSLEKVKWLIQKRNELKTSFIIQIDGGVNQDNASQIIAAGVDNLVAGSYIFRTDPSQYESQINSLRI